MPAEPPPILMWTLDRDAGTVTLHRADGKVAILPFDMSFIDATSRISRWRWVPGATLIVTTRAGDEFTFESPMPTDTEPLEDRIVVYLDQNQWRLVALAAAGDARIASADAAAVEQLIQWIAARRIVVPASSAHYLETTKWTQHDNRYDLGVSVLRYSRGWQMRHPIAVRRDELVDMFAGRAVDTRGPNGTRVFTLAPDVLLGPEYVPRTPSPGLDEVDRFFLAVLTSTTVMIDLMLDSEPVPVGPPTGWDKANSQFGATLAGLSSVVKRRAVMEWVYRDLAPDIAAAAKVTGVTPELSPDADQRVMARPANGLYAELMHQRHLNPGTPWKENDLIDMTFLSTAGGYADVVVGERAMAAVLRQAQRRLGRPITVFGRLREAVSAVDAAIRARHLT